MTELNNSLLTLPNGWVRTSLEHASQKITDGSHYTPSYVMDGYPFITITNLKGDCIDFSSAKLISEEDYQKLKDNCNPQLGDILFSKDGTVGKVVEINYEKLFIVLSSLAIIRPFKWFTIPAYLKYLLLSQEVLDQATRFKTGTALTRIILRNLKTIQIPIPPLPEQHRIVAKIEELFTRLDAGVSALNKIKLQLKRYRQSVLKAAFEGKLTADWREAHKGELELASVLLEKIKAERARSGKYKELPPLDTSDLPELPEGWVWTRVGEIESFIGSGITPKGGKNVYVSSGIIFIRSQNIYPSGLRLDDVAYITPEINLRMKRSIAYSGDVLLNITGASIGRSTFIPESFEPANVNQHVCIIRMHQGILPKYLSFLLNSPFGQSQIFSTQGGVTRQGLNYTQLRSISFPLQSIPEQQNIVEEIERHLSVADETEKTIEQSIKQADRLRQSILKRAFEGKLVPQNPDDEPAEKLLERIITEKAKQQASPITSRAKNKRNLIQGRLV
ncbi:restriction endonuclease subunit S [Chloroflexota bacterium]